MHFHHAFCHDFLEAQTSTVERACIFEFLLPNVFYICLCSP